MFCEFTLPSNPEIKVRLREATVAEAIDFSSIDPDCEEEATSVFLEKVQEKETYSDPRGWTGEDRRFALFAYYVKTTDNENLPIKYICPICGKEHSKDIKNISIMNSFTPMDGKPYREFPFNGHNAIVYPLNGADLEAIEKERSELLIAEQTLEEHRTELTNEEIKELQAEIRSRRVNMAVARITRCVDFPYLDEKGTRESRRNQVEKLVMDMPAREYMKLMGKVGKALGEMRHGLRTAYQDGRLSLEIPDVKCALHPEEQGVLLLLPFRFSAIIPSL